MSDVSVRMTLQDDVSAKMQKITASARTAATQFSNAGRAMDSAFRSSAATSFASQAGSAFNSVESDAEALGNAIDEAVSGIESFSAGDTRGMGSAFSEAADSADDLSDSEEETSDKEPFDSNAYDREVSGMEESLDVVQVREEEVPLGEPTEEMPEQENDPPAGRRAYVVSEPTVTDDDLSDTKDENLLGLISRKRKKNKSE